MADNDILHFLCISGVPADWSCHGDDVHELEAAVRSVLNHSEVPEQQNILGVLVSQVTMSGYVDPNKETSCKNFHLQVPLCFKAFSYVISVRACVRACVCVCVCVCVCARVLLHVHRNGRVSWELAPSRA